jgi:hypothetical protein
MSYLISFCNRMLKTDIFGGFPQMDSIRPRLHTRDFLWDLHRLSLVKEFGRLGHRPNATSLFGWWLTTDVGQQIAMDSLILSTALYVIRLQKLLVTS